MLLTSDKAVATFIGVRWDGDKVRGIRMELSDGSFKQAGGYDDGDRARSSRPALRAPSGEAVSRGVDGDGGRVDAEGCHNWKLRTVGIDGH